MSTLKDKIKDVIEDVDTAIQIQDKICEKYHEFFVKKVGQQNGDVKKTKAQIQAEVSRVMCSDENCFNIDRKKGQLNTYSMKQAFKKDIMLTRIEELLNYAADLLVRIEELEIDYGDLYDGLISQKDEAVKGTSWWSKVKKRFL